LGEGQGCIKEGIIRQEENHKEIITDHGSESLKRGEK